MITKAKATTTTTTKAVCRKLWIPQKIDTKGRTRIRHQNGMEMPYPMNHHFLHGVPICSNKVATKWRISLTLREII